LWKELQAYEASLLPFPVGIVVEVFDTFYHRYGTISGYGVDENGIFYYNLKGWQDLEFGPVQPDGYREVLKNVRVLFRAEPRNILGHGQEYLHRETTVGSVRASNLNQDVLALVFPAEAFDKSKYPKFYPINSVYSDNWNMKVHTMTGGFRRKEI